MIVVIGAWTGHTLESAELAEDVRAAINAVMTEKEAAWRMDIPQSSLSNQFSGKEQMSAWRLASLGWPFWIAFMARRCKRIGYELLGPGQLMDLINSVKMFTGKKAMAKVEHVLEDHEREDVA